jgi:hypothetical protein
MAVLAFQINKLGQLLDQTEHRDQVVLRNRWRFDLAGEQSTLQPVGLVGNM